MSINNHLLKIKSNKGLRITGSVTVVLLVGIAGFGMGRLSGLREVRTPIILGSFETGGSVAEMANDFPEEEKGAKESGAGAGSEVSTSHAEESGTVVASKNGKVYHLPWCAGAKRISEANKVTFASAAAAEKAGLAPAHNCPGLTDKTQ